MAGPAAALGIDVVANITEAQAALAKVQAQLEATAATSESAAAKSAAAWTAAGKKMQTVGKSMTKYITVPAVAAGAVAVKLAADFDKSMALIQTQAGASASEVKKLSAEVLAFAKSGKTQFSPNDLAQALYSIESAGIHGAKAMDTLKASAQLATVGQADLAETTKALAAAQKTGIKGSGDLKKAIGTLNATVGAGQMHMDDLVAALGTGFLSTAKTAGLSLTDVGTALDELTKQGMPAAAAATRLRMTMSLIAAPSTSAAAALKGIGLSSTDMANAMRGKGNIIDALQLLQDHLDGLSHTQVQQVLTAAFGGGRSSGAILSLLGNLDDVKKTMGDITANTDKVGESFRKMQEEPSVQLERVWSQMQAILIDMGNNLIPKLIPLVKNIASVLNTVISTFTAAPSWVQDFLIGAVVLGPFIRGLGTIVKLYGAIRAAATGAAAAETASAAAGSAGGAGAAAAAGGEAAGAGGLAAAALPAAGIAVGVAGAIVGLKIANDKLNANMEKAVKQGFQPEGLIHFGNAMDKVKAQIKKVHDATSGLRDARKNERDTAAAEAKAEQHLLNIRQKYGPDSRQAIRAEGQAARATDAHRIAVQKLQLADRLQGIERKIEERDLVRAAAQQRQQIESLRTQRQNILANVKATGIQNMSNKQLEMTQQRLNAIDKQQAERQKNLNDLKQKAVKEIGPGYAKQLGVETAKQNHFSDQLKATAKSNQIVNDGMDSSIPHIQKFTDTLSSIKKWSSDTVHAFASASKASADGTNAIKDNANSALKGLGVGKSIDFSTFTLQGTPGAHQRGGRIVPGKGSGDTVPAMLEPGEFVLNREAVKGIGAARLESMNKAIPRFAKGGGVDFGGHPSNVVPAVAKVIGLMESHFPGLAVSSTTDGGHVSGSYHYQGKAVDLASSDFGYMDKAAAWVKSSGLYKSLLEGIHNPNLAVSDGQIFPGAGPFGAVWAEHLNHIHLALDSLGKVSGGIGAVAKKIKRQIIKGPKGALGAAAQMGLDHVWNAANKMLAKESAKTSMGGSAGQDIKLPGGTLSKGEMRKLLKAHNLPDIFGYIAEAESSLNPNALGHDPGGTTGYGLWQITSGYNDALINRFAPILDPNNNASAAYVLSGGGRNTAPWAASQFNWGSHVGQPYQRGGMIPSFGGGGKVPGPIGQPRVVIAHGGEDITPANKPARYQITITNWKQGTGYMEEIADGAVNGQRRLGNQLSRMSRA